MPNGLWQLLVIVKISFPIVKIAVLKNLLIFDEKYLPQSVRLLEGEGGVEMLFGRMPFEHAVFLLGASLTLKSVFSSHSQTINVKSVYLDRFLLSINGYQAPGNQ